MNKINRLIYFSLILTILILSFPTFVDASTKQQFNFIEDKYNYFTEEEKLAIEEEIKNLPETYEIIVLPTVNGSVDKVAEEFFDYQEVTQDTILILVLTEDRKINIFTDEALEKRGIDENFFSLAIENYFNPSVKSNEPVSEALIDLINGISQDIPKYIASEKNAPKIPETPAVESLPEEDDSWFKPNLIYGLIALTIIFLLGYIFSKGLYRRKRH